MASAAVLAFGACTRANDGDKGAAEENAKPAAVLAPVASDGKVMELSDASVFMPGVKVSQLTVLDFNAVWCGPCRQLTPVVEALAAKYAGRATFVSVDVDKYGALSAAYNLGNSVPVVLFLYPDGKRKAYYGTGDLLPAEKFDALVSAGI